MNYWPRNFMFTDFSAPGQQLIQGWQCPQCFAVWSPWVKQCSHCETKKTDSAAEQ